MSSSGVCSNIISARHKKDGFGSVTNPEKFLNQDYEQLKQYCLIRGVRYIDDMFPPDRRSIGDNLLNSNDMAMVEWKRPQKIVHNPSFVVDGVSRFDFGQGIVGNCWFLASIGALTFKKAILAQVVPLEQRFDDSYCGLFHFRFWRFGRWVDVIIDDKLPTINGHLIFVRSKEPTEFWPALMEKAYAKVCGSYAGMSAGTTAEALVDFTGGVHICINLRKPPPDLWELMSRAGNSEALMGCGTPKGATSANTVLPNGIVQGHAYSVTGVLEVQSQDRRVCLVRLFNPWGTGEWNGPWSDRSSEWGTVTNEVRTRCLSVRDDGEFWMTLEDFCTNYDDLDICCGCPDFLDGDSSCHWRSSYYEGRWVAGTTAGGCINDVESFATNPQFRIQVEPVRDRCAMTQSDKNMLVSLMQKPDKRNRALVKNLHIGFSVYEVTVEYQTVKGKMPASFFRRSRPIIQIAPYVNAREVMELCAVKPGAYLIVPSTFNPNETATFILTILSKADTHVHETSGDHDHEHEEGEVHVPEENGKADDNRTTLFRQFSDKYEEVDAEMLQQLLNQRILKGDLKNGGFTIDACRSMVALMDTSITGKLNADEFQRLWKKIDTYKEIFSRSDVSQTGTLSLGELRNALMAAGKRVNDDMLNILALRYGAMSGHITLENFVSLVLRFHCMAAIFRRLSEGVTMTLHEGEWLYLSMYT